MVPACIDPPRLALGRVVVLVVVVALVVVAGLVVIAGQDMETAVRGPAQGSIVRIGPLVAEWTPRIPLGFDNKDTNKFTKTDPQNEHRWALPDFTEIKKFFLRPVVKLPDAFAEK